MMGPMSENLVSTRAQLALCTSRLMARTPRLNLLFLDLDGTVRYSTDPSGFCNRPEDVAVYPEALAMMDRFKAAYWRIVGVSNQEGVARGDLTWEMAVGVARRTGRMAKPALDLNGRRADFMFDDILICPGDEESNAFRKPNPGMLFAGMQNVITRLKAGVVHLEDCLMVGDSDEDRECARRAGIAFMEAADWRAGRGVGPWLKKAEQNLRLMRELKKELGLT